MERTMISPMRDDLMVQQQVKNAWQHMVGVIMLNQTHRGMVKKVLPQFLHIWPNHIALTCSEPQEVYDVIWPLGMMTIREKRIRKMSEQYLSWDGKDATKLYGIGKYGSDSYEIFFKNNYSVQPTDKELLRYLKDMDYDTNQG